MKKWSLCVVGTEVLVSKSLGRSMWLYACASCAPNLASIRDELFTRLDAIDSGKPVEEPLPESENMCMKVDGNIESTTQRVSQ